MAARSANDSMASSAPSNGKKHRGDDVVMAPIAKKIKRVHTQKPELQLHMSDLNPYVSESGGIILEVRGHRMLNDPVMQECGRSTKYSFITGPQGVGKSHATIDILCSRPLPMGKCCVYIAPSRALARQVAGDLQRELQQKGDKRRVLLYLEKDADTVPMDQWDFLVVGPLSTHRFVEQVNSKGVSLLVLDELPEIRSLCTTFKVSSAKKLAVARAGVALLLGSADNVIAISAQTTKSDAEWLVSLEEKEGQITVYESTHIPRQTRLLRLSGIPHALRVLSSLMMQNKTVICFCETVEMAMNLCKYVDKKVGKPVSLAFTKETNEKAGGVPASDVTAFVESKECQFFAHTSALGLGMNVNKEFYARMVICDKGFISMKKVAQEIGRARNTTTCDVFTLLVNTPPQAGQQRPAGRSLEQALDTVALQYPEYVVPVYNSSAELTKKLLNTQMAVAVMEDATGAIEESHASGKFNALVQWRHNTSVSRDNEGRDVVVDDKDVEWEDIVKNKPSRSYDAWAKTAIHCTADEMKEIADSVNVSGLTSSDSFRLAMRVKVLTSSIMPHMVQNSSQIEGRALSTEFLFDVCRKFEHLQNLLKFAEGADSTSVLQHELARTMFAGATGRAVSGTQARAVARTVVRACGANLKLELFKLPSDPEDVISQETVDPQECVRAYEWVSANWGSDVRSVMGRNHPKTAPGANSKGWYKFVRSLMRVVFGFGLRLDKSDGVYEVVPSGFWKKHGVDVVAIVAQRREQAATSGKEETRTTYNGREYGQYPMMTRHCDGCPAGSARVQSVRQHGTQWLCTHHRDYHSSVDCGYLDEIPGDSKQWAIMAREIIGDAVLCLPVEEDDEETETDEEEADDIFKGVEPLTLGLLSDIGFSGACIKVTSDGMRKAWMSADDVEYLQEIDTKYKTCLARVARQESMKVVRKGCAVVAASCGLVLGRKRVRENGKRSYVFTLQRAK